MGMALKSTLQKLPLFGELPEELLDQILEVTSIVEFMPEDEILRQGEYNVNLYFLLLGTVDIYVDGGRVASLSRKGDLLGEMSVITNKPCSASIVAQTPVSLCSLNAEEFRKISANSEDKVDHILYRIYSSILTDKLQLTNQKAKRLEETMGALENAKAELQDINQDLEKKVEERTSDLRSKTNELLKTNQELENKNTEISMSFSKLEEMYQTRDVTFEKLQKLYSEHLTPLKDSLEEISSKGGGEVKASTARGIDEISGVMRALEPLTQGFSVEKSIRSKKVLLVESVKKQQVVAKMALGGTGVKLEIVSTVEEAIQELTIDEYSLVLSDLANMEIIKHCWEKYPNIETVLMTSDQISQSLPDLKKFDTLPNLLSRSDEDKTFSIKNIMTTVTKLVSGDVFGLEKYLAWGVEVQERKLRSSTERGASIQSMQEYFKSFGVRSSKLSNMATVAEELLMNAIYDAPTNSDGESTQNHLNRTQAVTLEEMQRCTFRYASDGTLVALSVEDPFGALRGQVILNYLDSCYNDRAGELNKDKGGAGRGLHQIIENSDLVVFNIKPKRRTEVICLFNIVPGQDKDSAPSFHYFKV